ncbi:LuxR C-terminal-related transcriptional regulator [Bifidobacterium vespertilionis]|uniref:response regulator transcription factor n=1 Tax=Bifidobacterium vespertilionis TaxID=2562524 RepID=UPI001BDC3D20|nr:response regulator transcription factor [Bifidobacterium vespertilionis]MBT1179513.1 response regulator transcription factor [Bifidobacterium vespertilionis]
MRQPNISKTFTVAIVDNDPMSLKSITSLVASSLPQVRILWAVEQGSQAVCLATKSDSQPNVLLVDMSMEDMPGSMVCRRIRRATDQVSLLAMTSFSVQIYADQAWRNGAQGIVGKGDGDELIRALLAVANGSTYGDGGFESEALSHFRIQSSRLTKKDLLSDREIQVMDLLAEGLEDNEIAEKLSIGRTTVRKHLQSVKQKLGARNRIQMVLRWVKSE